ncbi:MAG TPA: hypothetical protein VLF39_03270 [Candidatus Saccharimonadales bacterium]|nr:hypothetical protein [Candidatus Saccharimonadales bacterium]
MEPGESVIVTGGTFPGRNERSELKLDLTQFMPIKYVLYTGLGDAQAAAENPVRPNPLGLIEDSVPAIFERTDKRFAFDPGDEWLRYGKHVGSIAGQVIDMILIGSSFTPDFYFVTKPIGKHE